MATTFSTPGVYIQEIPKFPPSIAEVETAIPVFIGYTQRAGTASSPIPVASVTPPGGSAVNISEAVRITSLLEYETYFGTGPNETLTVTIEEVYEGVSATDPKTRVVKASVDNPSAYTLYYHMQLYFANGGGPCYVISVGDTSASPDKNNFLGGIEMASRYDEPTLIVVPQANGIPANGGTLSNRGSIYTAALNQAATLQDRFVIMDVGPDEETLFRTAIGINDLKYGAAYFPYLRTTLSYIYDITALSATVKKSTNDDDFSDPGDTSTATAWSALSLAQQAAVKLELANLAPTLPPSAAIAGIYAYVDSNRGVWKAPANVSLNLVSGLTKQINDQTQGLYNIDGDGKSINVIRAFTGKGIIVWGARTLAGNDNEWRYVSVRRFFNMVEESTKKASGQFVFEPNDANTWTKVQGMIENYLTTLWRAGALQGAKPEHAFYVAVGLNKTMTAQDILEGRMIVEIGMAVVRPAEFIILRFSHKMAES